MKWTEKHEGFAGQRIAVVPRPILATALHHPLLKQLLPTDAGYFPKAEGHLCSREQGCPESVFVYCAHGAGWCEMEGRKHPVRENQFLVIPAGVPHVYGAAENDPWTIYWFHVVGTNLSVYLEMLGVSAAKPVVPFGGDVQLFSLFEDVMEALEHGFDLTNLIYAAHSLTHLMGLILRHKDAFSRSEIDALERVAMSIEFMKAHVHEPLRRSALAAMVHLSPSHYASLFRRVTGFSPADYFIQLRMQRAVRLLNTTKLSVKEVAWKLGYSDQFYFSRAFNSVHGHSPSQHRLRYKMSADALPDAAVK